MCAIILNLNINMCELVLWRYPQPLWFHPVVDKPCPWPRIAKDRQHELWRPSLLSPLSKPQSWQRQCRWKEILLRCPQVRTNPMRFHQHKIMFSTNILEGWGSIDSFGIGWGPICNQETPPWTSSMAFSMTADRSASESSTSAMGRADTCNKL